jgi:heme a synthase
VRLPLKSPSVALWLYCVAALVVLIVLVGGATRLTDSGLSITEWKPIHGIIPPLNAEDWANEFNKYKQIPEYKQVNAGMSLAAFQHIYWWEWAHRILGRIIGLAIFIPFVIFLIRGDIPKRLIWRCGLILGLVGVQGVVGWWMVHSGLSNRIDVAPERLMTHLSLALLLMIVCIWTGTEALEGQSRSQGAPLKWQVGAFGLLGLIYLQSMLGALVAGNDAGFVYSDWPLMNGRFIPYVDYSQGLGHALFHDQAMVQFLHRMNAYLILTYVLIFMILLLRSCMNETMRMMTIAITILIISQVAMGVATLMTNVQIGFGLAHQLMAVGLLILATLLAWKVARADRDFRRKNF